MSLTDTHSRKARPRTKAEVQAARLRPGANGMHGDGKGFDITCSIGSVRFEGSTSDDGWSPDQEAFRIIGEHDAPGTYRFPRMDGRQCVVTVEHEEV